MVISVWNSFLSVLRSRVHSSTYGKRRRIVPKLGDLEQVEDRILLAGNLTVTDAYLVDSQGVPLPVGTFPVVGEAVYVTMQWSAANLSLADQYTVAVQLRQFQKPGAPPIGYYSGQGPGTFNLTRTEFAGYAAFGQNSLQVFVDVGQTVNETNESTASNSMDISFVATDPLDPLNTTSSLIQPFIDPVTGVANKDWFRIFADADPRPSVFVEDYTTFPLSIADQEGDNYIETNFDDMDQGRVVAVAIAPGTVLSVVDGNFDRNTSSVGPGNRIGNSVEIDLGNGWTALYSGFMQGTITVQPGDQLRTAQVLGLLGASDELGRTHINLKVYHNGNLVNLGYAADSYFINPLQYPVEAPFSALDFGITNVDPAVDFGERPQEYTTFTVGSSARAWLWVQGNRYLPSEPIIATWYRPNGTVGIAQTITPTAIGAGNYLFFNITSGVYGAATGTWQVALTVGGTEVARKSFSVSASAGAPEIRVQQELGGGASNYILNDRTTPVDFGVFNSGDAPHDVTFTIQNTGGTVLTLNNLSVPEGYNLVGSFPPSINPGTSAQFTIRLVSNSRLRGQLFGNVAFNSNDPDEQRFRFAVNGIVNLPLIGPNVDHPGPAMRYLFQMFPQIVSPTAQIVSPTPGVPGFDSSSSLQVYFGAGGQAEDRLAIRNQGTAPGQIGISGSNVTYGGTVIGTFAVANDAINGGQRVDVAFNNNVTLASAQALMRNITYVNTSVVPNTHPRYVLFRLTDYFGLGGDPSDLPPKVIDVVPDTLPPTYGLVITPVTVPSATTTNQDFQVVYNDEVSVNGQSVDANDVIFVRGPSGGTFPVQYLFKDSSANGLQRTSNWTMVAPGGFWDIRDNGTYDVMLKANEVTDINGNISPAQVIGSFTINLPNVLPSFTNTIGGQFTAEDTPTSPIAINITDLETLPGALVLSASSNNLALVAANGYTFGGTGANRTLVITPQPNAFGTATITVQVADGNLGVTSVQFLLTVSSVNDLPVVSVIPNQDIQQDTPTGTINFTVSDVETASAALLIAATSDNPGLILNSSISVGGTPGNPTLVVTPQPGEFGIANISVTVTDSNAGVTTNVFQVLVRENSVAPVIVANQVFTIAENSLVNAPVGTVQASDADVGETLTYAITAGDQNRAFDINPTTGALTVRTPPLFDFETVNLYTLTISVTDSSFPGVTTSGVVTVNVSDVNEAPVVQSKVLSSPENPPFGTPIWTMTSTDVDSNKLKTFSIISGNPNNAFVIDPASGLVTVNNSTAVDYEAGAIIVLTIGATDFGTPPLTGTGTLTINLGNVNEPPVIDPQSFTIPENSANITPVGVVLASDQDVGQTLQYSIFSGNSDGAFAINPSTGAITVANSAALNFEALSVHQLVVRVADNANPSLSAMNTVSISLSDINEPPTIDPQSFSVNENSNVGTPVGTVVAINPESISGQSLTFSIIGGNTNGAFVIDPFTGELQVANKSALNYESPQRQFNLTIQALDDGSPVLGGTGVVTVNLGDLNDPPQILDQVFTPNENLGVGALAASVVATDEDQNQALTFAITSSSVPGVFAINPQTGAITVANSAGLNFETNPTISLVVQVTDSGTSPLSNSATMTFNLRDVNDSPVVPAQTISFAENQVAGFSAGFANATDEDLPSQTLTYSIVGGNTGGAFAIDPSTGQISIANASAINFETNPRFLLQVQARDNGATPRNGVGVVTIDLTDENEPPLVPTQSLSVPENSPIGFVVGSVVETNPERSQSLLFEVLSGNEAGAFNVNSSTGVVTVANSALLDFENPVTFVLTIRVTDSGSPPLTQTGQLTITVADVNEFPVFDGAYAFTINENTSQGTVLGTIRATDPDNGQTLAYSISSGNGGNAFVIDPMTGVLSVGQSAALDFETTPVFNLVVQVLDNGEPRRVTNNAVTVNLLNVNDAPKILPQAFQIDEILQTQPTFNMVVGTVEANDQEQPAGQTISYAIQSGNEDGAFAIDSSTGVLTIVNRLAIDFETHPLFNLAIRVTDTATPTPASSTAIVMVSLRNLNEPPFIPTQSLDVPENSGQGTLIGAVNAIDREPGQTVTFSIESGNSNGAFTINANTGVLTVANPLMMDFETHPVFTLVIKATDNANPPLSSTGEVTVNVLNVNERPIFINQSLTVAENTSNGTVIGKISAFDPDGIPGLNYSIISGNEGNAFTLDPQSGDLTVANSAVLNFEARQAIVLTVRAIDAGSLANTATVSVTLTNVNDEPTVADATFSIAENSPVGSPVGGLPATDPDGGQIVFYSLVSGNTNGAFAIHSTTGKITVANPAALDFETNPTFTLGIRVTDTGVPTASHTATVVVNLTNIDEPTLIVFRPGALPVRVGQKNVVIDSQAVVQDLDSPGISLLGGTLTVSLSADSASRGDQLALLSGINGLTIKGKSVIFGNSKVGNVAGGKHGTPLYINLTGDATLESLQAITRSVAVSLNGKRTIETMDVKYRLSGTPGLNGAPSVKTLTFVEPFNVSAVVPKRHR